MSVAQSARCYTPGDATQREECSIGRGGYARSKGQRENAVLQCRIAGREIAAIRMDRGALFHCRTISAFCSSRDLRETSGAPKANGAGIATDPTLTRRGLLG